MFYNISHPMVVRGYWDEVMALGQQSLRLAGEEGDELTAARFRVWPVAWIHRHRGELELAEEQIKRALAVIEQFADEQYIAYTKRHLGRILQERGELEQAENLLSIQSKVQEIETLLAELEEGRIDEN
jgi:hypothetical protein